MASLQPGSFPPPNGETMPERVNPVPVPAQQPYSQNQVQQRLQSPVSNASLTKYLPPNAQQIQQPQQSYMTPPTSSGPLDSRMASNSGFVQKSPINYQSNFLINGGSSQSSRTSSPALNYSQNNPHSSATSSPYSGKAPNVKYLPPMAPMNTNLSASQNFLNRNIDSSINSGANMPPSSNWQRSNDNLANLSNSMQNLTVQQGAANRPQPQPPVSITSPNMNQPTMTSIKTMPQTGSLGNQMPVPHGALAQHGAISTYKSPVIPASTTPATNTQQQYNQDTLRVGANPASHQMSPLVATTNPVTPTMNQNTSGSRANNNQFSPPSTTSQQFSPAHRPVQQGQNTPTMPPASTPLQPLQHHHQQQQQPQPIQPPNIRKPMYPPANAQPPMPQQQQQRYAYGSQQPSNIMQQQYEQQAQSPSTFNGHQNTSQLQYQGIYNQMSVAQQGFSKLWGHDTVDLMQQRHILPTDRVQPPPINLNNQFYETVNCSPEIMRCTVNKVPESSSLLQKSRLPLGILIHPFRDMSNLVVINCPTIVRCRLCRTYINPFVHFVDSKMWKCNLCYRINELPEDFQYDPVSKTYGEVTRRPEVRSSTIEFIAPSEYMLRPPQPAIYLFLFDVSIIAQQTGYLDVACEMLSKRLDSMPGDARTKVGIIAFNSEVHFYNIAEGHSQPHEITLVDIDDIFLPCPDNLLVNINACKDLIKDLLSQLPTRFAGSHDSGSALGAALQVALKLMSSPGGRITVFQTCLPNKGPGALQSREDPNNRSAKDIIHLNPATDFYKRLALDCSGQQIAVDLFLLNQQYSDLATLSGMSKYSGGCVYHFPLYQKTKPQLVETLKRSFDRYLTRKIGFEAVMRVRCTRGLQIHTFHGNFFVRSTDLLSLPNVNPDAGYGMQISYDESLTDIKSVCFQAALLYTTSSGERRIRVHTMCLPVTTSLTEVMFSADVQCIVGLLAKMAVDRSLSSSVADARDAFINATVDIISAFKVAQNLPPGTSGQVIAPKNLALLPLYIAAILKHIAFRTGTSTRLDDRIYAMDAMKTLPLDQLMKYIYPEFYHLDALFYNNANENDDSDQQDPPLLQLSAEFIDSRSMFLLDCGTLLIIYVGMNVPPDILQSVLGIQTTAEISDYCYGLPQLNTPENDSLHAFIESLNENKPYDPIIQVIRDTSTCKSQFFEKLVDDRSESSLSYYEFLQHLRTQVK